ncbi:antitoxin Xre/MbcA/ParS toxin-binding domain-containing protein [Alteriqipengyuania sp. 357]
MSNASEKAKPGRRAAGRGKIGSRAAHLSKDSAKPAKKIVRGVTKKKKVSGKGYYFGVYSASPTERISMIREGVPAQRAKWILRDLGVEQRDFFNALGLKTATVNRKVKDDDVLSFAESERLIGFAKLVGQLDAIVAESGDPEGFDSSEWMSRWLLDPLPSLGGRKPIEFLDTMEGQTIVSSMIARMQSGAYA